MFLSEKFTRPFLALLLSAIVASSAVVPALAEDNESGATQQSASAEPSVTRVADSKTTTAATGTTKSNTATTKAVEESTTKPTASDTTAKSSTTTTTVATTEPATEPTTESTTEPTTEPTTKPAEKPDFPSNYTGIAETIYEGVKAWWRVENGKVQPKATGVYQNQYGWWYVKNGKVDFNHTGIEQNKYGWWRIENGNVNFKANGVYQNRYGWWKVSGGKVDFSFTGLAQNQFGWWRIEGGQVNFKAEGFYKNKYGTWYVKGGKVDFGKTGTVTKGKQSYTVRKGKVEGVTIKVPLVNQLPNYPTGCEAASATMVLQYYGYDINIKKMVAAIPRENLRTVNGKKYGPRITEKFVGDPRYTYTSSTPGYGAFAPVVTKAMNTVITNQHGKHTVVNKTGASLSDLFSYIDAGKPVVVWSTYNMKTPSTVNAWYIATSTGPEYFSYPRGTHVCVLVGYDQKNIYLADPYGATIKTFSRSAFNDKYKLLGKQAVVVL